MRLGRCLLASLAMVVSYSGFAAGPVGISGHYKVVEGSCLEMPSGKRPAEYQRFFDMPRVSNPSDNSLWLSPHMLAEGDIVDMRYEPGKLVVDFVDFSMEGRRFASHFENSFGVFNAMSLSESPNKIQVSARNLTILAQMSANFELRKSQEDTLEVTSTFSFHTVLGPSFDRTMTCRLERVK